MGERRPPATPASSARSPVGSVEPLPERGRHPARCARAGRRRRSRAMWHARAAERGASRPLESTSPRRRFRSPAGFIRDSSCAEDREQAEDVSTGSRAGRGTVPWSGSSVIHHLASPGAGRGVSAHACWMPEVGRPGARPSGSVLRTGLRLLGVLLDAVAEAGAEPPEQIAGRRPPVFDWSRTSSPVSSVTNGWMASRS